MEMTGDHVSAVVEISSGGHCDRCRSRIPKGEKAVVVPEIQAAADLIVVVVPRRICLKCFEAWE
jgi:hypothetical protein